MVKSSFFATWRRVVVVCLLALMGTSLAFAGHADRSHKAEGLWEYMPLPPSGPPPTLLACDDFPYDFLMPMITALTEEGRWSGTFNGMSYEAGTLVIHCTGGFSFYATVTFGDVEVHGKLGGLVMRVEGSKPDPFADWYGTWTLVDGTGELTNLRGRGDWWGPGYNPGVPDVWGQIYYDGKIKWFHKPSHAAKYRK